MSERTKFPMLGSVNANEEILSGSFTIGSSGAISAQTGAAKAGFVVTQDATGGAVGRYLVTFYKTFKLLKAKHSDVTGPAAGTAFPTTTGISPRWRLYTATAPNTKANSLQLLRPDTMADADAASGTVVHVSFIVQN